MSIFSVRKLAWLALATLMALSAFAQPASAQSNERALYLYYTHTQETARIVFRRNGQYVQSGLNELNQFLRDWRRNEPANMDPRLFDLVWEVYQEVGGTEPINVVSAYRSPATNAMLASRSSGVADDSQHMRGTAMDFFIPGVPLARLRAVAMRKQVGGVGYYPTSGSPFVHLDTGSVRAWPRMTRAQLAEIFPDGRTMHLPPDGTPLSREGYDLAMAEWQRCHAYPCGGSTSGTAVASAGGSGRTLVDMLFGGGGSQTAPATATAAAAPAAPAPAPVQTAAVAAPAQSVPPTLPEMRPADLGGPAPAIAVAAVAEAPAVPFGTAGSAPLTAEELGTVEMASVILPVAMPSDLRSSQSTTLPSGDAVTAIAALTGVTMPTPRVIMTDPASQTLTAYAPVSPPNPEAQRALEMIIGSTAETQVAAAPPVTIDPRPVGATTGLAMATPAAPATTELPGLFRQTFGATQSAAPQPLAQALAAHVMVQSTTDGMRRPELVAPDLDHVADIFTAPAAFSSDHYAFIFDRDEADFDPTPEMGAQVVVLNAAEPAPALTTTRFSVN